MQTTGNLDVVMSQSELTTQVLKYKYDLFQAEKVIGATNTEGELMFLVKWKGSDEADLVTKQNYNFICTNFTKLNCNFTYNYLHFTFPS